jgi:hypothetical protein
LFQGFGPLLTPIAAIAKRNSIPLKLRAFGSYAQITIYATLVFLRQGVPMPKTFNPPGVAAPASRYSHGVEVSSGARWLYISGQVGTGPTVQLGKASRRRWNRFCQYGVVLESAGMTKEILSK